MLARPILAVLGVSLILSTTVLAQTDSDDGDSCPSRLRQSQLGTRTCSKACTSARNCGGSKQCLCDSECGLSCINPNANCPTLDDIDNGNVDLQGGSRKFGSIATYTCSHGYRISRTGDAERHCQGNREWSGIAPTCVLDVSCGLPPDIENARHDGDSDSYDVEDRVMYNCNSGYFRRGIGVSRCLPTRQWSIPPQFECVAKSCGSPGNLLNGRRIGNLFTFPNRVYFECDTGYTLSGRNYRTCQTNQEWSGSEPACLPVNCPRLDAPIDGEMFGSRFTYNQQVRYQCNRGFKVVGSEVRTCQADATWSGQETSCQEINCGPPEPIWNGYRDSNFFGLESIILFTCNVGFKLEGSRSSLCQEDETWSTPTPKCWGRCTVEEPPDHGSINSRYIRVGDDVQHGSFLSFSCDYNYEKSHEDPAMCYNGTWQNIPTCNPKPCTPLQGIEHGSVDQLIQDGNVIHGSTATYSCDRGYYISNDDLKERQCSFERWYPFAEPVCIAHECSNDRYLQNGIVKFHLNNGRITQNPLQSVLIQGTRRQFECDEGYSLEGEEYSDCDEGDWTSHKPVCNPDPCEDVSDINGVYRDIDYYYRDSSGELPHLSRARVTCIAGRTLIGDGWLTCRAGKWYPEGEQCIEASCTVGTPPEPLELYPGYNENQQISSGDSVRYQCEDGYQLTGSEYVTCRNGHFGDLPECSAAPCSQFSAPYHGTVTYNVGNRRSYPHGTIATIQCNFYYELVGGGNQRVCQFGSWTGGDDDPQCDPASCSLDNDIRPDHSSLIPDQSRIDHSSSVSYGCQDGFQMEGYEYEETLEFRCWYGQWKYSGARMDFPECKPKPCYLPIGVRYIDIQNNWLQSGDSQSFYCVDNKVKSPSTGQISCLNGNLVPHPPKCLRAPCEIPQVVAPLKLVTSFGGDTNQVEDGTAIKYGCFDGFGINSGDEDHICHNGIWSTVPVLDPIIEAWLPTCTRDGCTPYGGFRNGIVTYTTRLSSLGAERQIAQFQCNPGFELYGSSELICDRVNDQWLGQNPSCQIRRGPTNANRDCSKPQLLENGTIRIDGRIYIGTRNDFPNELRVTFSCFDNFRLDGFSYSVCEDGQWTNPFPICVDTRRCQCPTSNPNVSIFYKHKVLDGCINRYFPPGSVITQRCTDIFKFSLRDGSTTRTCVDGRWTGDAAVCVESELELGTDADAPRMVTENGTLVVYPHPESILYVDCMSPKTGSRYTRWFRKSLQRSLYAYRIHGISDNYRIRFRPPRVDQSDTFTCRRWLAPRGTKEHTIDIQIREIGCPSIEAPANGQKALIQHPLSRDGPFILGDQVRFSCKPGYRLEGASLLTCTYREEWSDPVPVCLENTCPAVAAPDNGHSDGVTLTVGSRIRFTCDDGYILQGGQEIECMENLMWSAEVPTCQDENRCGDDICTDWEICVHEMCICRPHSHCQDQDAQFICGSDGNTYRSMCRLNATRCLDGSDIHKEHDGKCPEAIDPCDGYCTDENKECYLDDDGNPNCRCIDDCDDDGTIVCGSNGVVYANPCSLRVASCETGLSIAVDATGSSCVSSSTDEDESEGSEIDCESSCGSDTRRSACDRVVHGRDFVVVGNVTSIIMGERHNYMNITVRSSSDNVQSEGEVQIRAPQRNQDGCLCPHIELDSIPNIYVIFGSFRNGILRVEGNNYVQIFSGNEHTQLLSECPDLFV